MKLKNLTLFLIFNYFCSSSLIVFLDASQPWQLGFQEAATPIMEGIVKLHDDVMLAMVFIGGVVFWLLFRALYLFDANRHKVAVPVVHGTFIEIIWTITPAIILLIIAVPSFALLYSMDEIIDPVITIKAVGHQWYWSYEFSDYLTEDGETILFDSYLIPEEDLQIGQLRLLEVDNRVVIPAETHIRLIITAADVLHCFAVPSFGIKLDACPGRLNQTSIFVKREGVYYGQCSEICGVNHAFMPIVIEAVSLDEYSSWVANRLDDI